MIIVVFSVFFVFNLQWMSENWYSDNQVASSFLNTSFRTFIVPIVRNLVPNKLDYFHNNLYTLQYISNCLAYRLSSDFGPLGWFLAFSRFRASRFQTSTTYISLLYLRASLVKRRKGGPIIFFVGFCRQETPEKAGAKVGRWEGLDGSLCQRM